MVGVSFTAREIFIECELVWDGGVGDELHDDDRALSAEDLIESIFRHVVRLPILKQLPKVSLT